MAKLDNAFWKEVDAVSPAKKIGIFVRLDEDVVDWLRSSGRGYQTRMNAMLRAVMKRAPVAAEVFE